MHFDYKNAGTQTTAPVRSSTVYSLQLLWLFTSSICNALAAVSLMLMLLMYMGIISVTIHFHFGYSSPLRVPISYEHFGFK